MKSQMYVSPHFDNFIFDWDYEKYLLIGSYGSGKSHAVAQKLIIKLYSERRKACVFRQVYETHKDSTFELIKNVLEEAHLLADEGVRTHKTKVCWKVSPLQFKFPNGSKIIFKGMDNKEKIKSLTNVSIAWIEECSELSLEAYLEILGRVRTYGVSMHFILTCNPIGKFNWVYQTFFSKTQEDGTTKTIVPDELFYEKRILVKNGVYYHHSTCDDNPYLPRQYIIRLDEMKNYDKSLWLVARLGRFGEAGLRVLPQFETLDDKVVYAAVAGIEEQFHKCGMDFGFETSYNAVVKCAVDLNRHILYIYDEYYKNHMTDDKTAIDLVNWDSNIKNILIKGDCAEPKTIQYFRQEGFNMRPCRKLAESKTEGSRIANTKKIKRFARIICARHCINTIRELKDLTYKKNKNGEVNYGDFNIDSHTFKLKSVA